MTLLMIFQQALNMALIEVILMFFVGFFCRCQVFPSFEVKNLDTTVEDEDLSFGLVHGWCILVVLCCVVFPFLIDVFFLVLWWTDHFPHLIGGKVWKSELHNSALTGCLLAYPDLTLQEGNLACSNPQMSDAYGEIIDTWWYLEPSLMPYTS